MADRGRVLSVYGDPTAGPNPALSVRDGVTATCLALNQETGGSNPHLGEKRGLQWSGLMLIERG